jgi:hypothetical protein
LRWPLGDELRRQGDVESSRSVSSPTRTGRPMAARRRSATCLRWWA